MIYAPGSYGDGFVTIEELRRFELTAGSEETAATFREDFVARVAAREAILDIAEQIWCEREGWWEVIDTVYEEFDGRTRRAYFHPPTHGGWVMVPVEPTLEMLAVAGRFNHARDSEVWACMLSAAPSAPVGG